MDIKYLRNINSKNSKPEEAGDMSIYRPTAYLCKYISWVILASQMSRGANAHTQTQRKYKFICNACGRLKVLFFCFLLAGASGTAENSAAALLPKKPTHSWDDWWLHISRPIVRNAKKKQKLYCTWVQILWNCSFFLCTQQKNCSTKMKYVQLQH